MKLTLTLLLVPFIAGPVLAQVENEEQLRNPAYLIKKYNQLALQYNALVDKGRQNLNSQSMVITPGREVRVTNPINEALERANTELAYKLQSAQSELTQAKQRKQTVEARTRFLEQENSQLKDKLREFRISESDLEERSKRLVVENRRAKTEAKNFDILEKQLRSKIRKLENSESDANRQLTDLKDELRDQIAILRKSNSELGRENSLYQENQKINDDQTRDLKGEIRRLSNAEVSNLDIIEDLKGENELLFQKNAQLAQRNKELDVAVQLMDQEIHEITRMEQNLQTNLSVIDEENKVLMLTIDKNRNERDGLRDQIRALENNLAALDRRNLELSGKLGMLRDHRMRLRNEIIDVIEQEDGRAER